MKSSSAFLPIILVLGTVVGQNPVPTRVSTILDGPATGYPDPITITLGIDAAGTSGPALAMSGGIPQAGGVIILGASPAMIRMPQGTLLLLDPLAAVAGVFDPKGKLALPLDVSDAAFVGVSFHAQGLQYQSILPVEYFQMTPRLTVAFTAGNKQPSLYYDGPPLTATLLTRRELDLAPTYEVFTTILAPTGGYDLRLQSMDTANGVTSVYLVFEAPAPDKWVPPQPERKLVLVDLGTGPEARIDVMVEARTRGVVVPPVFRLAAMLVRDS